MKWNELNKENKPDFKRDLLIVKNGICIPAVFKKAINDKLYFTGIDEKSTVYISFDEVSHWIYMNEIELPTKD